MLVPSLRAIEEFLSMIYAAPVTDPPSRYDSLLRPDPIAGNREKRLGPMLDGETSAAVLLRCKTRERAEHFTFRRKTLLNAMI